jgi:RNA polymerase sigma-70 factor (ECF subfamily)
MTDEWSEEFSAICAAHRGRLVRWVAGIFGARDAEDIAHEALVRLYLRPGTLRADADAFPWLAVVARNVGRDLARRDAATTAVEPDVLDTLLVDTGVHETVAARDDAARLREALRTLSPRDRMLLQLRDVDGVPIAHIAERLRTSDNTARQQIHRARRRLASAFLARGGERRTGLLALVGGKARELARRAAYPVDAASPATPGLLAALSPLVAVVVGGGLLSPPATPSAQPRATARVAADAAARTDAVDAARSAAAAAVAARRPGSAPPLPALPGKQRAEAPTEPWVDADLGPIQAAPDHPLRGYGDAEDQRPLLTVTLPVVGQVEVENLGSGRSSRLCRHVDCEGQVPRPRPRPAPDPEGG